MLQFLTEKWGINLYKLPEAFGFFYSERIAIDLTRKRVGGILKEMEMPEHRVISTFLAKSRPTFSTHRAALFFTLFYRVDKRVLL